MESLKGKAESLDSKDSAPKELCGKLLSEAVDARPRLWPAEVPSRQLRSPKLEKSQRLRRRSAQHGAHCERIKTPFPKASHFWKSCFHKVLVFYAQSFWE